MTDHACELPTVTAPAWETPDFVCVTCGQRWVRTHECGYDIGEGGEVGGCTESWERAT